MKSEIRVATKIVILFKLFQVSVCRLVLTVSVISIWTQVQWITWLHFSQKKKNQNQLPSGTKVLGRGARPWQEYAGAICACMPVLNGTK